MTVIELQEGMRQLHAGGVFAIAISESPAPWSMSIDGRQMLVTTDGWVLVAVAADVAANHAPERVTRALPKWLSLAAIQCAGVQVSALRQFAGDSPSSPCQTCHGTATVRCDACDGDGEGECSECGQSAECEECNGDGTVECLACRRWRRMPASLLGVVINRAVLRRGLALVNDDGTAMVDSVSIHASEPDAIRIRGAEWALVAMGMRGVKPEAEFSEPTSWGVAHR